MKFQTFKRAFLSSLGYIWGITAALAIPVLFMGSDAWSEQFSKLPFMKIHPRYTGGELRTQVEDEQILLQIHEPVFDGLIGKREDGFVQIDVVYKDIPIPIEKSIDFDSDGTEDFQLTINLKGEEPSIKSFNSKVGKIERWARTDEGFIVRVALTNLS